MPRPEGAEVHPEPIRGECQQVLDDRVSIHALEQRSIPLPRSPQRLPQGKAQLVVEHQADHPQRRAAEGKGILRPRGALLPGKEPRQKVQSLGQGNDHARRPGGARLIGPSRGIVLPDGSSHILRLTVGRREVGPHHALEFRELAHEARHQVRLGEPSGPGAPGGVRSRDGRGKDP